MANPHTSELDSRQLQIEDGSASPACVMTFNANDPSGAGGLTADITAITSAGAHPLAVVTGAYLRDTAEIFDHFSFDDETVTEQARAKPCQLHFAPCLPMATTCRPPHQKP